MDDDVSVVLLGLPLAVVHLCLAGQGVVEVRGRVVGVFGEVCFCWVVACAAQRPSSLPCVSGDIVGIAHVVFPDALCTHHAAGLTTAVDFEDLGTAIKVYLGIFVPGARAVACTVDRSGGHAILVVALAHGHVDVDEAVERATLVVVAAVDGAQHEGVAQFLAGLVGARAVVHQHGVLAVILHMGFIHVAGLVGVHAVAAAEDAANPDGGALRHVHHRAARHALLVAGTVGSADLAAHQVDDGRSLVEVETRGTGLIIAVLHAYAAPGTGTEHLHGAVFVEVLRALLVADLGNVYEHVAAVL